MPMTVVELGKLMMISNKKDFPLKCNDRCKEVLKYPESFRASLLQVRGLHAI
ncbi:unnamed protein product [Anisakis simplex]|uniref:Transposase n=1 Tax=Anisakis simplex TaxID=6269 RepID=A0A0M3JIT0_ANISI|nr:unnamed protein product [Anisakis simplex]